MNAKEIFKSDYSAKNLTGNVVKVQEDLVKYFEGLPLKLVKHILRDFERGILETSSIVTLKES